VTDKITLPKPLVWRSLETLPEYSDRDYLAIDSLGYIHVTHHQRSTLIHAGWAEGWHPLKGEPVSYPDESIQEGGKRIAAVHAREFRRLVTQHRMPLDTVIEGVCLAPTAPAAPSD
jgi:hypothetical protein